MLSEFEQTQKKWAGVNLIIDRWLLERQDLLVLFCELSGLPPFHKKENITAKKEEISRFCQLLIDYISTGHFEVFVQSSNLDPNSEANLLIAMINKSTDYALRFNESYSQDNDNNNEHNLNKDLSLLGQYLEERFDLEDKVVSLILGR